MKNYKNISIEEKNKVISAVNEYDFNEWPDKLKIFKSIIASINNVYLLNDGSNEYIFRESKPGTDRNHIVLETELIDFLNKKGFLLVPKIIANKHGKFITEMNGLYFILQSFMPGETIANWDNLDSFNLENCIELFSTSAIFTKSVQEFKTDLKYKNIEVSDYVEKSFDSYDRAIRNVPKSDGRVLLDNNLGEIRTFLNETIKEFEYVNYRKLPKQIVHFDFHPGNVNYMDNKITGIFDFDWIRFDSRITDIASTISQSCYFYGGPEGGLYRKDRIQAGLESYRKAYGKSEFDVKEENNLIRIALKGYIVYQLLFFIEDYAKDIKNKRIFVALDHFIKLATLNDYKYLFS